MNWIDYLIVCSYLIVMLLIGFIHQKKAATDTRSYFLGGNKLPWWLTAISMSMASIDITGTMVNVSVFYFMGIRAFYMSIWVISGVALMCHLGRWIRRSGVVTAAEWMTTRFGKGWAGELPRLTIAIISIGFLIGMVAYAFVGVGKFVAEFVPALHADPLINIKIWGIIIISFTTLYALLGGLFSVAYTDLIQTFILVFVALYISIYSFFTIDADFIAANTPAGWQQLMITTRIDYLKNVSLAGYNKGTFEHILPWFLMWISQTFLAFFSGPSGGPGMQFMLSTKSVRDTCKQTAGIQILAFPRWTLIAGLALLAMTMKINFSDTDTILPVMINTLIPVGMKGIVLIGFLAAFMSTFSISINNGCSYVINDIYLRHIRPNASHKEFIVVTYIASVFFILVGILIGSNMQSILELSIWIFAIMMSSMIVPLVLRWYWWRFNGWGFSAGMFSAFIVTIVQKIVQKNRIVDWPDYYFYYIMIAVAFVVSIMVTLITPATDKSTLKQFYRTIHPWGNWKQVRTWVQIDQPDFQRENMFTRDLFNMIIGAISIFCLNALPFFFMLHNWTMFWRLFIIFLVTAAMLYYSWYKALPED